MNEMCIRFRMPRWKGRVMLLRRFGLTGRNYLSHALGAGLVCCVLLGGIVHAQAPQEGALAPAAPASTPSAAPAPGPAARPQGEAAAPPDVAPGLLPRDLTPWGMFMAADIIVKAVMIGLLFASVVARPVPRSICRPTLASMRSNRAAMRSLMPSMSRRSGERRNSPSTAWMSRATCGLASLAGWAASARERAAARLAWARARLRRAPMSSSVLASQMVQVSIGATAPFVGLFGTVWGIMNSFIGISKLHTTNLAVVAPGIAEALLATTFGLAAAIPAVVIYNMFSRSIAQYRALYADTSVEILTLVSRDLVHRPERRQCPNCSRVHVL
jgi:biopolymer transport protein ExbB